MTVTAVAPRPREAARPPLHSVLCGVNGSPAGREAVRQAAVLAGGAPVELVAVTPVEGGRLFDPLPDAARGALAEARRIARGLGCAAFGRVVAAGSPVDGLLDAVSPDRLLAVGCGDVSGPHGPVLGPVPTAAVLRAPGPALLARAGGEGVAASILVAFAGAPEDVRAARAAARIAARHRSDVAVLAAARHDAAYRGALAEAVSALEEIDGTTPLILEEYGSGPRAVAAAVGSLDASLVVVGAGPAAEAVARAAPCSVLVDRSRG